MAEIVTPKPRRNLVFRLCSICGIMAPPFFTIMVLAESLLRPGYSQISDYISELGVGQYAILQSINFWVFGILVFLFALDFGLNFLLSRAVTVAHSIVGWMIFLAGVFPTAPFPYPGNVHNAVSRIAFLSIMVTEFLVWWRMLGINKKFDKQQHSWATYSYYSFASGIMSIFTYFLLFVFAGGNPPIFVGLFQRLFLGVAFLWLEIMGLNLFKTSHRRLLEVGLDS